MNATWAAFKRDPYYLTSYLGLHVAVLTAVGLLMRHWGTPFHYELSWSSLWLLPLAFIAGIQIPVLMHNCTHGNLKSNWLNNVIGELTAFFCLMGVNVVRINHNLHHAFADTHRDPHDPAGKSFFTFIFTAQITGVQIIRSSYLKFHGDTPYHRSLFFVNVILQYLGHGLRAWVWYLVLGQALFIAFYVPAFITFSLAFAHVNYITHQKGRDGDVEVINKDDNLYYNFINFIGSGVYYHKNHHRNPKLMNPMKIPVRAQRSIS